jgi:hypothetical protein
MRRPGLLYKELGLRLAYLPAANQVRAELGAGVSLSGRVRGGTRPLNLTRTATLELA